MKGFLKLAQSINIPKTIWFNLKAFSFKEAMKLPVVIKNNVKVGSVGRIVLKGKAHRAMMVLGGVDIKGEGPTKFANKGTIILNSGRVIICKGTILENYGLIEFKGSTFISENTRLLIREKLELGSYTRIGFNTCIMDSNDHFLVNMMSKSVKSMTTPIVIGDWNWLGCYTFVKKGTKTPNFLLVSAPYAVLCKDYTDLKEGSVIAGIPAKLINESHSRIIFNATNEQIVRKWFFAHRDCPEINMTHFTDNIESFCK